MSVTFNVKPITNEGKWNSVKSGEFLVLEPVPDHPIPAGLYRVFLLAEPENKDKKTYCILPLFDGNFVENMFPYTFGDGTSYPKLAHKVTQIQINVEIFE